MLDSSRDRISVKMQICVFLLVAGYALVVGVLVQEVIVPKLVGESASNGLLPVLDTVQFHELAVDMVGQMEIEGWSAWEWDPGWSANQPVGIMAAVYYWLGPDPIYLLPINAIIHGLSAVILLCLFQSVGWSARVSFAGILPFVFFPSTLTWVSQFHKDGLYCLGLFSMFLGCVRILSASSWSNRVVGLACLILGAVAAGAMRGYGVTVFIVAVVLCGTFVVLCSLLVSRRKRGRELLNLLVFLAGLVLVLPFAGSKGGTVSSNQENSPEEDAVVAAVDQVNNDQTEVILEEEEVESDIPPETPWQTSEWLPGPVDRSFHRLIHNRTIFFWLFSESGSLVDEDQEFRRAEDVMLYFPRAVVIGLLAPFPDVWFGEALTQTGGMQRKVSAVETALAYVLLAGCVYGLIRWPGREKIFVVLASILLIVALVYPVPAVGSLYRLRFGAFSLLLGMGAVSIFQAFTIWRLKRQ